MVGLFRSEDMQYVRITMKNEAAVPTIQELGRFSLFHFEDLVADASEPSESFLYYKKRLVQCTGWERRLRQFEDAMTENKIPVPAPDIAVPELDNEDVLVSIKSFLEPLERDLERNVEYRNSESRALNALRERSIVLENLKDVLFTNVENGEVELDHFDKNDLSESLLGSGYRRDEVKGRSGDDDKTRRYVCGAMPLVQLGPFERMLWRMSRGNAYMRSVPLEDEVDDPQSGEKVKKAVFYVVCIAEQLKRRVMKMCDYFRANVYDVPDSRDKFDIQIREIGQLTLEKRMVLEQTSRAIQSTLERVAFEGGLEGPRTSSPLRNWQEWLRRERLVCDALKKCQSAVNSDFVTAEGWIPTEYIRGLQDAVRDAVRQSGAQEAVVQFLSTHKAPPTYLKTNKFTSNFQGIVDTYGVPHYKEVNPGLFTIVTFPFLFGVMYGDMGHGATLFFASLFLVLNEDKLNVLRKKGELGEIPTMVFGGRYLLLLMGFFGFYAGTVYNDCLSVPINLFGTNWFYPGCVFTSNTTCVPITNTSAISGIDIVAVNPSQGVYPYGVDPGWYNTKNELAFFNSMKMKIAVTLGVVQMTFGIILSFFNHLYFSDYISIFCEFIPQMVFMMSTFGYMIFMIIFKFTIDWTNRPSPNLIQTMISMFLSPGSVEADKKLYDGQAGVQVVLVLLAVFSIPLMLFPKPFMLRRMHEKKYGKPGQIQQHDIESNQNLLDGEHKESEHSHGGGDHGGGHGDSAHFEFSEHFIHQCIHTIEFVLGAVSNTASYLRLWALSLAHAELANVFWNKLIMQYGVEMGPIFTFIAYGAWAGATFAVLLCMDVLECFLHALRLHWVEFQNKFYRADGYAFEPFTFVIKDD